MGSQPVPLQIVSRSRNSMEGGYDYFDARGRELNEDGFLTTDGESSDEGSLVDARGYIVRRVGRRYAMHYERARDGDTDEFIKSDTYPNG